MQLTHDIFSSGNNKNRPRKTTKRKINPEFTMAIRAASMIRICAASMSPDRKRFHRLAKFVLHNVIQKDTQHQPGERQILPEHVQVFEGYEFEQDFPLSGCLKGDMMLHIDDKLSVHIPVPALIFPEGFPDRKTLQGNNLFCKMILLGVGIDFAALITTSVHTDATPWIAINDQPLPPVHLEIPNAAHLFIAMGIAITNNTAQPLSCQAVRIIAVNQ